jgi:uncharacterized phage protein (TIGR02218 family)
MPYTDIGGFAAFLAGGSKTLAVCLRMVRKDGTVFAFTNHTQDISLPEITVGAITVPATTYQSENGCIPTDLSENDSSNADNMDVTGALGTYVTDADVRGNLFQGAEWTLILCNYADTSMQQLRKRGTVGEATVNGLAFTFSLKSLSSWWQTEIIELAGPMCRYKRLGVSPCPFDMTGTTTDDMPARITTTVASVTSQREITLTDASTGADSSSVNVSDYPTGRFTKGTITWNDGDNAGQEAMDIQEHKADETITLKWKMPFDIAVGDSVTLDVGCDRRISTCGSDGLFDVAYAFGGEEGMPTTEQVSAQQQ